jgi:hypothetical protein
MKTSHIIKRLQEDTAYQEFFKKAMDKFGINSIGDLSGDKKKEFFNYIDKNYTAKVEENTMLMGDPAVAAKVEMVIKTLQDIDVDGETMQYILEKVGMGEQMQHQLTPGGIR